MPEIRIRTKVKYLVLPIIIDFLTNEVGKKWGMACGEMAP
jgi:hypothetical protein